MSKRFTIFLLMLACPLLAHADGVAPYEEYATHLRAAQEVTPLTSSEFGDQVSLYNRSTEFDVVDIDVPGNNALPVQLRRHFDVSDRRTQGGHLSGFGEWDLDVPYLEGVFSQQFGWVVNSATGYNRCSDPSVPYTGVELGVGYASYDLVWDGYQMHMPGHGFQDLLVDTQTQAQGQPQNQEFPGITDGNTYPWITKDYTRLTCMPKTQNDPGEGFVAVSPDGTKTYFDWLVVKNYPSILTDAVNVPDISGSGIGGTGKGQKLYAARSKVYMLASRMEDRFGNWVHYNWGTDSAGNNILVNITSSDGRTITPTYTSGHITGATSNVGNWSYGYITPPSGLGFAGNPSLQTVTRPDQSTWTYSFAGSLFSTRPPIVPPSDDSNPAVHCQLDHSDDMASGTFTYTVGAPFGATATYQFNLERHFRSYIPLSCNDGIDAHYYPQIFDFIDSYTLDSKTISGPGLATQNWTYGYNPSGVTGSNYFTASVSGLTSPPPWASQVYVPQGDCTCALSKQVVVTGPTEITKYTFGMQYARNDGRLLATEVDGLDGTVLRTTSNTFVADADVPGLPFPSYPGTNLSPSYKNPSADWIRPQSQSATVQDGVTFTNQTNAWDVFARPTSTTRSSTLGFAKTENTTYADNTTLWVMGQLGEAADGASGQTITHNDYDPATAMLADTLSFGLLQKSYTYHPGDGTDQAGTLSTVADGLNQTTTLASWKRGVPQTVDYADGSSESAVANDSGWITSYTDENGYTTGYQYDTMGRVKEVDYPTGDTVAWTPTTSGFVQVNATEYGLPAGHWRHIVATGASKKTTYYDAMLRPVLQRDEDTSNAATIRYTEQAFDAANRTTFAAYPVASVVNYNDALTGTNTGYDGLGRVTAVAQDSEQGTLMTNYAYLPGFLTQVTNPRSYTTTTAYQAFDAPDTSHPVSIASPEGVTTNIARDVYGKPQSIARSGTWNGAPISETRSYTYDAHQRLCERVEPETGATLIAYDAADNVSWTSPGNASTTPCTTTAPANAIARTYDLRNRPLTESVPGSTPIAWGYYPDGALKTLTSGSGATANVWSYTYNMRRMPVTEQLAIDGRIETIGHAYNALGNETGLTYPSGYLLSEAHNALGQQTKAGTFAAGVTYFPNGAMSGFTYGNGIVHSLVQNARGLPQESTDAAPGTAAILDDTYSYDQNANVAAIADGTSGGANNRSMTYDGLDRLTLTQASGQPWIAATTVYDALDNIRSNQVGNTPANLNTYAYDPGTWHITSVMGRSNWTLGYDANGNIASKGTGNDNYGFDVANRMQSVTGKESYVYDGYGRRVKVTALSGALNGKIDYPVYDMSGRLITEDDQRSSKTIDYVSLNGALVVKRIAPLGKTTYTLTYEHTDALHSPTYETNGTGALTRVERYTPYGEPSDGTYSQGPGFTGHVTDAATGLTYAQQRYYDPVLGMFLSPDSVQASDNGASFNRYWYANNNPYKFTDVDGRTALGAMGNFIADTLDTVNEDLMQLPPEPAMLAVPELEEASTELRELSADSNAANADVKLVETADGAPPIPKSTAPAVPEAAQTVAKNGETATTKAGRQEHKDWDPGEGYQKEVKLPSGRKADAVNFEQKRVKELKPDNARAVKRGEKQVEQYRQELQKEHGGDWKSTIETYKRQ